MKKTFQPSLFPWFTIFTGAVGFSLRRWLFSVAEPNGLLPENHLAGILTFLLLALTLLVCAMGVKRAVPSDNVANLFPSSRFAAIGTVLGAIGMGCSAFMLRTAGILILLVPICGTLATIALVTAAFFRLRCVKPHCLLHGVVTLFLIVRTMACCRSWGAEPQMQLYFFEMLASLFLLIASYYRTELDMGIGDYRRYAFFSQAALFCCCLSILGDGGLFYLSAGFWMATDYCMLAISVPNV